MVIQRNFFLRIVIVVLDLVNVEHVSLLLKLCSLILCDEEFEVHFLIIIITDSIHLLKLFLVIFEAAKAANHI